MYVTPCFRARSPLMRRPRAAQGKFQVQFDSTVVNLDASAATYQFQQELFAHTFTPVNGSASHLVKLTAVLSGDGLQGKWLDVDYITFASGPSRCVFAS